MLGERHVLAEQGKHKGRFGRRANWTHVHFAQDAQDRINCACRGKGFYRHREFAGQATRISEVACPTQYKRFKGASYGYAAGLVSSFLATSSGFSSSFMALRNS